MTFVLGGPKNYTYKLKTPNEDGNVHHFIVREITLNMLDVNSDVLKRLVTENPTEKIMVTDTIKNNKRQINHQTFDPISKQRL